MDAATLPAPVLTPALITALFSTDDTVIVQDTKTGAVTYRKLTAAQADSARWIVLATRDSIVSAAAEALTAQLATEWAL